ncbi:PREDICTED: protein PHLOEM PROTEIN 2-LIKE A9-like [Ipomoea nil]|uniref:protein PHLOEM PROTEIN 2-LIKE A9-like n=1 Tax=Ipomoea nil TaxID=35883 RepID=UPI000901829E|nr:PREDICTED: protein PHLOEM PROTEIN 2-LIKE A9-like [Ipomoea nil]
MKAATPEAPADPAKSGTEAKSASTLVNGVDKNNATRIYPRKLNFSLKFSLDEESSNGNWKWESSGEEAAALVSKVIWLEVTGEKEVDPTKKYEVKFKVSLKEESSPTEWENIPLYVMARRGKKRDYCWKKFVLSNVTGKGSEREIGLVIDKVASNDDEDKKLYFGLYDIWSGKLKKGLAIHYASVQEIP